MGLSGVANFEGVVSRYEEWLHRENHDRPLLHLTAPRQRSVHYPASPATLHERWFNFEWRIDCFETWLSNAHFEAEGVPTYFCNLGPDIFAAFLGAEMVLAEDTTWVLPLVRDWADYPPLRFDPRNQYWQAMERFLGLSAERGRGKWLTATGDIHSSGDANSALRGPQHACLDVIAEPDRVRVRLEECHAAWKQVMDRHFAIIQPLTGGLTSSWISAAIPGRYAALQNDFSCMVGPETFRDLYQDIHRREAEHLDYAIYHWDGPGAIPHFDALCEIESINAIQWVPGAGNAPMREWVDLLRQVQDRGKGLYLYCDPGEVLPLTEALEPEGLMLHTSVATPEDARALLRQVESVSFARR